MSLQREDAAFLSTYPLQRKKHTYNLFFHKLLQNFQRSQTPSPKSQPWPQNFEIPPRNSFAIYSKEASKKNPGFPGARPHSDGLRADYYVEERNGDVSWFRIRIVKSPASVHTERGPAFLLSVRRTANKSGSGRPDRVVRLLRRLHLRTRPFRRSSPPSRPSFLRWVAGSFRPYCAVYGSHPSPLALQQNSNLTYLHITGWITISTCIVCAYAPLGTQDRRSGLRRREGGGKLWGKEGMETWMKQKLRKLGGKIEGNWDMEEGEILKRNN